MKRVLLFALVLPVFAVLFLVCPQFTRPVFASTFTLPNNCPWPHYAGCRRGVSNEYRKNGDWWGGGDITRTITGDVSQNMLIISDGATIRDVGDAAYADVYGGIAKGLAGGGANVHSNWVYVRSGSEVKDAYGGASEGGKVYNNEAAIDRSTVHGRVVGGWAQDDDTPEARGNIVRLSNSSIVTVDAIGGYTDSVPIISVRASSNRVIIESGGEVRGSVYGAKIEDGGDDGLALNNEVNISAGKVANDVYGAYIGGVNSGIARGNRVAIADGSDIGGNVVGAHARDLVSNNNAFVKGSKVTGYIYGGLSWGADAVGNSAYVEGATVEKDVIGGKSTSGAATGNSAALDGGIIKGNLYGGSGDTEATKNSVTLYAGTVVGDVVAGHSAKVVPTINNTVTLYGGTIDGALLGGSSAGDITGNTLNLRGQAKAGQANNFERYNITVPPNMAASGTMLEITGGTRTSLNTNTVIDFTFDPSGTVHYQSGDKLTLIDKTTGTPVDKTFKNIARGVSSLYDVQLVSKGGAAAQLMALVKGQQNNPQSQTLSGPVLTGLTLLNLGADLVAGNALDQAWKSSKNGAEGGRWSLFSNFTYEDITINDNIDVNGWSYLMGLAWRDGNDSDYGFLAGGFFETGYADYDGNQNYAGVGRVRYDGNVYYYGFGALARYKLPSRLRLEGSLRFGLMDSDYGAKEYAGGQKPQYSVSTLYTGAHLGAGWDMNLTEGLNMDLSAKYFWVRQFGETVRVGDERLKFEDADSHRIKAGTRLTVMPHKHFDLYAGAYGEYEMGGNIDAKNKVSGSGSLQTMDLDDGASGVFELGIAVLPYEDGARNLVLDFMLTASVGRRQGFGGHFSLGWNF